MRRGRPSLSACRYHPCTMSDPGITRLRFDPQSTVLSVAGAADLVLGVGIGALADAVFRHDPPTPAELERAIDLVEDALMASRLPHAERGELFSADALLRGLPGLGTGEAGLTRAEVETLFQRLALASLGDPAARGDMPSGARTAAALLVLRECMHHLGYDAVRVPATGAPC